MNISDLIIDEEFESVIPPLTDEEFELLKESVFKRRRGLPSACGLEQHYC